MIRGFNKANSSDRIHWLRESRKFSEVKNRPCIFLSHKYEDKPACREIAKYLKNAKIDYYFDEEDATLQQSVLDNDHVQITENIKTGIRNSTHMLCVISKKTYVSNWVPFEVGYGHAAIIDNAKKEKTKLSILLLEDLSESPLPEYMSASFIIEGAKSFDSYIGKIRGKNDRQIILESINKSYSKYYHPLANILNLNL